MTEANVTSEQIQLPACSVPVGAASPCTRPRKSRSTRGRTFPSHSWGEKKKCTNEKRQKMKNLKWGGRKGRACGLTTGPPDRRLCPPACRTRQLSWSRGGCTRCSSCCPLGGAPAREKVSCHTRSSRCRLETNSAKALGVTNLATGSTLRTQRSTAKHIVTVRKQK